MLTVARQKFSIPRAVSAFSSVTSGNPTSKWIKPRIQPYNLRQSGDGEGEGVAGKGLRLCLEQRLTKSPYFHLAQEAGAWCFTVYNKRFHPRAYVKPEDGGLMQEYKWLTEDVTMWNVAVERQTCIKGPDAEKMIDMLITRRASLCKALNFGLGLDVEISEIDVSPVQIQGPKSTALMVDLVGPEIEDVPYYGLLEANVGGCDTVISRTGFSAERGYEIYLRDATMNADKMWNAVLEAGKKHNLHVIAPGHHRRIEAGILSFGQDMDTETNPFECGLGWQVDLTKDNFVGKAALAKIKAEGVTHKLTGITFGGEPITWYPADLYHVKNTSDELVGHVTSAWYSPTLQTNIGFAFVPIEFAKLGTQLEVSLPKLYNPAGGMVKAEVVKTPFKMPAAEEMGTGLRATGSKL